MYVAKPKVGTLPDGDCEVWWRADDRRYANYDPFEEFEQPSGSHLVIHLTPFAVLKHTPKGVWVRQQFGSPQFVLGKAIRQICVPTKELALQDLVRRKERHVQGCEYRLAEAKEHLKAAKYLYEKEKSHAGTLTT